MRLRELRVQYVAVPDTPAGRPQLKQPTEAAAFFRPLLEHEASEVFLIAALDTKNRVIAVHTVSRGTLDSAVAHPREVFKAAILANAATIVTAHNHPSGEARPSLDDAAMFRRLTECGKVLGIEVADHLIIGHDGRFWSERNSGGPR